MLEGKTANEELFTKRANTLKQTLVKEYNLPAGRIFIEKDAKKVEAVDKAIKTAVRNRTKTETHGLKFIYKSGMLFIELPSGRRLAYVKPKIEINQYGSESVTYEGVGATKKWERLESYGPKFVENIIQAISRDILCYAMQRLSYCFIVGHVHDEMIIECSKEMSLEKVCEQMGETPPWIKGLLLRADGYECEFYKKD